MVKRSAALPIEFFSLSSGLTCQVACCVWVCRLWLDLSVDEGILVKPCVGIRALILRLVRGNQ